MKVSLAVVFFLAYFKICQFEPQGSDEGPQNLNGFFPPMPPFPDFPPFDPGQPRPGPPSPSYPRPNPNPMPPPVVPPVTPIPPPEAIPAITSPKARSFLEWLENHIPFIHMGRIEVYETDIMFQLIGPSGAVNLTRYNLHLLRPNSRIVYIIHGYLDSGATGWMLQMANIFLTLPLYQVILVDFRYHAFLPYYRLVEASPAIARILGNQLAALVMNHMIPPTAFHLIGHSIGVPIAAMASRQLRQLTNMIPGRITGMDTAGPGFMERPQWRPMRGDAHFFDNIHANDAIFGLPYAIGNVDFYPNGGDDQPGCGIMNMMSTAVFELNPLKAIYCSHFKVITYFMQTITQPNLYPAMRCQSYNSYLKKRCLIGGEIIPFGIATPFNATQGKYYFTTSDKN